MLALLSWPVLAGLFFLLGLVLGAPTLRPRLAWSKWMVVGLCLLPRAVSSPGVGFGFRGVGGGGRRCFWR